MNLDTSTSEGSAEPLSTVASAAMSVSVVRAIAADAPCR